MKHITLYRSMFKIVDGDSEFNRVLLQLRIAPVKHELIDSVDLILENYTAEVA